MDYNTIAQNNLDEIMKELAEYTRMAEEIAVTLDSLKDVLKSHMEQVGIDTLRGTEHKAVYIRIIKT